MVTNIISFEKTFGNIFRSYSELLSKFGDIPFQEYVTKGIFHLVLVILFTNLEGSGIRISSTPREHRNSKSPSTSTVWHRDHRDDNWSCLALGPSTAMCSLFLQHCTLTYKAVVLHDGPCQNLHKGDKVPSLFPLIVSWGSYSPWT